MNGAVLQLGRATQRLRNEAQRSCSSMVTTSFESNDQVAVITLNNPSKLNALTEDMGNELTATVGELQGKKELRAAILTGAGKAFSAGGDLAWLLERHRDTAENNIRVMQEFYKKFLVMRNLPVPVIAAINGPAVGGSTAIRNSSEISFRFMHQVGAGLCLAVGGADIRVASASARMGVTFTKLGLHPGMAATHFLPALVGPQVNGQSKAQAIPLKVIA